MFQGLHRADEFEGTGIGLAIEVVVVLFMSPDEEASVLGDGPANIIAGSHSGQDYYLFYFGVHQPPSRIFNLPEGTYRLDVIDTWDMKIDQEFGAVSGQVRVELPVKPYQAIRITRNG